MNCKALLNIAIEIALYKYCIIVLYYCIFDRENARARDPSLACANHGANTLYVNFSSNYEFT